MGKKTYTATRLLRFCMDLYYSINSNQSKLDYILQELYTAFNVLLTIIVQGSYSVWNTWKSMEFNFVFKVMNSMKFGVAAWKSMDYWGVIQRFFRVVLNFCMPVSFKCNLMKSFSEFC